ncbi:LOW QUALITY PROTEIN: acidic amino acid decarboxylase GADL1-like [Bacillus rossius redtenbacheri]|uniref:LOW QUALITY PROTEIN: acidic amino acid decarboxylase GADL1-like n=1 Tax=Bacillus rossius redtenbacheri TaxID=93214 RepID=UPI002FDD76CA
MSKNGLSMGSKEEILLTKLVQLLRNGDVLNPSRDSPVVRFKHPSELKELISLQLGSPTPDDTLFSTCEDIVKYSVRTRHHHFHNQLYAGTDPYGLFGAWLTEALNTNQHTFEVSPVFTMVEDALLQHVLRLVGYKDGDGILAPGGSISNMYGMVLARYKLAPDIKTKGLSSFPPLVVFTSEDSHYSVLKGAHWLGIGTENVEKVETDAAGRMRPQRLSDAVSRARDQGKLPLLVVATAGTTVLGAVDPLEKLADVCRKNGVWLHLDACWGGTLMLSKKYSDVLAGLERMDSIAWNPHKMLGAPLQCSLFLVKEKGLLHSCNAASASYLFQPDKFYDVSYDTGDRSVQCGRKVDAFKLWLMWKARGDSGLGRLVDDAVDCARYLRDQIAGRPGFRLVLADIQCTNVCFWFIPPALRGKPEDSDWWDKIHTVAPEIKKRLMEAGSLMIGYQPLPHKGLRNFFRAVTACHPPPAHRDMDHVVSEIETHGSSLFL